MKVTGLPVRIRSIRRYREIFAVLLKYGFEEILDRLHVQDFPNLIKNYLIKRSGREFAGTPRQTRLRMAIEELGPTFIKLGQMLSTRPDLIPPAYIAEFQKLQHSVSTFPSRAAIETIETELGQPLTSVFSAFEEQPLAAASIAQVHRAVTRQGETVVVKVQRPGIRSVISQDMEILATLAHMLKRRFPENEVWDPVAIIEEFRSWIFKELDFLQEARNADRFLINFKEDQTVYVPKVYWPLTSSKILTMAHVAGISVTDIDRLVQAGLDPKAVARNGACAFLKQVFFDGFFHGDPHPGNLRVLPGNVIAPLDYGLMGRLDDDLQNQVGSLLQGIVNRDIDRIERALRNMQSIDEGVNTGDFRRDLTAFIDRYYQVPLFKLNAEQIFREGIELFARHRIRLPRDLYLMVKSLIVIETIGRQLDPAFDLVSLARPYVKKIMLRKIELRKIVSNGSLLLEDFKALLDDLPETLRQILLKTRQGSLGINLHHQGLEKLIKEIDSSSNRISFSLIIAALIIGSSFIMQLDKGPLFWGYPLFGLAGYLFAAVLGAWLAIGIVRSGKM